MTVAYSYFSLAIDLVVFIAGAWEANDSSTFTHILSTHLFLTLRLPVLPSHLSSGLELCVTLPSYEGHSGHESTFVCLSDWSSCVVLTLFKRTSVEVLVAGS